MMKAVFIIICLVLSISAIATKHIVCADCAVKSIRDGINAAEEGDTVLVKHGEYFESQLVIDKAIVLVGINYPIVDGQNKFEIFSIGASGTSISGFIIQNCGKTYTDDLAGIKVLSVHHVSIYDNILCNNAFGIYLMNSKNCTVSDNILEGNNAYKDYAGNGIHLWQCDSIVIENNEVHHHRDGIYFEFVTNSIVLNNRSENNYRYGLHFMFSHNDEYSNNTFANNGAGVAVMYSHGVHMYRNNFIHNWGSSAYGLLLKEISDGDIAGNVFTENTSGIYLEGSSRIKVTNCTFNRNGWAMKMMSNCADNVVEQNIFTGNSFDVSTNGTLVLSTFNQNYWDKYEGYDLDRNGIGDIPFRPTSVFGVITELIPHGMLLFRSFIASIIDKMESYMPGFLPEKLIDNEPLMKEPIL